VCAKRPEATRTGAAAQSTRVEGAMGPDRITAAAHALGVLGVAATAGVAGPLRKQHRAGRRQLRGHRLSGRGHAAGRPFAGGVQHATTLPRRHVHRLTEVTANRPPSA
jgi:hypothetical protein